MPASATADPNQASAPTSAEVQPNSEQFQPHPNFNSDDKTKNKDAEYHDSNYIKEDNNNNFAAPHHDTTQGRYENPTAISDGQSNSNAASASDVMLASATTGGGDKRDYYSGVSGPAESVMSDDPFPNSKSPPQYNPNPNHSQQPSGQSTGDLSGYELITKPLHNGTTMQYVNLGYHTRTGESSCFSCCDQGGCCNYQPAQLVRSEAEGGTFGRVNFQFYIRSARSIDENPPVVLFRPGQLSPKTFAHQMSLLGEVSQVRWDQSEECSRGLMCCILPCFMCSYNNSRRDMIIRWSDALKSWQQNWNQELQQYGMFVKTQSRCRLVRTGEGTNQSQQSRHIERWIAIATTPQESEQLRSEPHLFGFVDDYSYTRGYEGKLCVHP